MKEDVAVGPCVSNAVERRALHGVRTRPSGGSWWPLLVGRQHAALGVTDDHPQGLAFLETVSGSSPLDELVLVS